MNKQFFYKRIEKVPATETEEAKEVKFLDSLNLDLVVRTYEFANGNRLVLLNDFHEEVKQVPIRDRKAQITGWKNERGIYYSEITLDKEDSERFVRSFVEPYFGEKIQLDEIKL